MRGEFKRTKERPSGRLDFQVQNWGFKTPTNIGSDKEYVHERHIKNPIVQKTFPLGSRVKVHKRRKMGFL